MIAGRRARLALAGLLIACGGALALFAVQAWRLPAGMRLRDESLLEQRRGSIAWPATLAPTLALLGAKDDVTYRRAVSLFLRARAMLDPTATRSSDTIVAAVEAGVVLGRIETGELDASRRSEATNLDAVLTGQGAELDGDIPELERAAFLLRRAIRLDRADEAAKANLEHLLGRRSFDLGNGPAAQSAIGGNEPGAGPVNQGY